MEYEYIYLIRVDKEDIEHLVAQELKDKNVRIKSFDAAVDLKEIASLGRPLAFIVGGAVEDPIQSAQRLHAYDKDAQTVLLARPENIESLKEAVKISPFIGMNVYCLDETDEKELAKRLKQVIQNAIKAKHYRDIIAKSNMKLSSTPPMQKRALNESFINQLVDTAPIGIAIIGGKGKVLGWNKEAASIFKKTEAQILGTPMSELFKNEHKTRLEEYVKKGFARERSGPLEPLELERDTERDSTQFLSISSAVFSYAQGSEKALILTVQDITSRIELLNQLKAEVKTRDKFLTVASHELRTPLSAMRLKLEFLREALHPSQADSLTQEELFELMEGSLRQTDRLNDLIEDLFDVAKIQAGKLTFNLTPVDLSKLVAEFAKGVEKQFESAGLEVEIQPNVIGCFDKSRIEQVLENLTSNASKYAPNSPVKISLRADKNFAFIVVQDEGEGISPEKQGEIFNRFGRATASRSISGLGLGLYITKKIVEGHLGEILVESSPGKGSAFTVKLPLHLSPEKQPEGMGVTWEL